MSLVIMNLTGMYVVSEGTLIISPDLIGAQSSIVKHPETKGAL